MGQIIFDRPQINRTFYWDNRPLRTPEARCNVDWMYEFFVTNCGWTVNAFAGLCGNLESESAFSPGRWEKKTPWYHKNGKRGGFGLTQWTGSADSGAPGWLKITNWLAEYGYKTTAQVSDIYPQCCRIYGEMNLGMYGQYIRTGEFNLTSKEFTKSNESPYWLGGAFGVNYERSSALLGRKGKKAKAASLKQRGDAANRWYTYITGSEMPSMPAPSPPSPPPANQPPYPEVPQYWPAPPPKYKFPNQNEGGKKPFIIPIILERRN